MKPYGSEVWAAIDALGASVDARLEACDARLTMGGEPTYVAADDPDGAEWNVAALGPDKERYGGALARRLAAELAPGALLVHGQGKWYPGEPLPRWLIGVHWRRDGEPLWTDPALLADPATKGAAKRKDVKRLMKAIAKRLGLPADRAVAAYEDRVERLWRESRLPGGRPPALKTPDGPVPADARATLIDTLDQDAGKPVGWALPLARDPGDATWSTGRWDLRRGALYLIPGDSPMGFRLPLDALTWTPPRGHPERSPFEKRRKLQQAGPAVAEDADPPPVTALCVEVRDGHLRVFLPPLVDYEHAVELVGIVERSAHMPLVIEGYAPPRDPRGNSFSVTPDPGVVEVNIHPSASWDELKARASTLHEAATEVGLTAEKYTFTGAFVGTGGGNHLTLGGVTPADSPMLRRPDLLRSMLTYWQHHPSLSYLFGGRFVGPTSQAPRVDEGRHETLYELEIAFAELDKLGDEVAPWQVDRALRNLLTDLTGNTHRAEFCVDKLFAPGAESGRLGVLELRGFEMPPHPQLSLVQALLVRALVARFCATPYTGPLKRWGTELHDRFLLPEWCAADIHEVASDLEGFDPAWLDPFVELRFPLLGTTEVAGVRLELRGAVEPWNVLGEAGGQGTARWVDSSVERVQIKAEGLDPERHTLTCNGHTLPLHTVGGAEVAGVRFTAAQLFSALHPTVEVHAPLRFDVVTDGASAGGCSYHPAPRVHATRPADAREAAKRRALRFRRTRARKLEVRPSDRSAEYPRTLDLRRV